MVDGASMRILLVNYNANPSRVFEEHKSVYTNFFVELIGMNDKHEAFSVSDPWNKWLTATHNFSIKPLEVDMVAIADKK